MNTQNTPIHPKLWHREFWLMALSNFFLSMSVYLLIPALPTFLVEEESFSSMQVGIVMGAYAIGLFAMGPYCNWLIQRYRRNHVFFVSVLVMALSLTLFTHGHQWLGDVPHGVFFYALYRIIIGAAFGLSQMILCSTLIIDTCESFFRTEANHASAWFGRFSLSLGPMAAILLTQLVPRGNYLVFDVSAGSAMVAFLLMCLVSFPFKVPEENISRFSLDRFFLTSGWVLFINLVVITMVIGILMTLHLSAYFYGMMMLGFLCALIAAKYVFIHVSPKYEAVTGIVLIVLSVLVLMVHSAISDYLAPVLLGCGVGVVGSRFLLYFIQLSLHCQRGTSQSSFFLAWECGIGLGLFVGFALADIPGRREWFALLLIIVGLLMYFFVTHPWYMRHKQR